MGRIAIATCSKVSYIRSQVANAEGLGEVSKERLQITGFWGKGYTQDYMNRPSVGVGGRNDDEAIITLGMFETLV